jgi:multimeric flavodoxin WrbA
MLISLSSAPNYMGGIQGKLKCALDRLYAFMKQGLAYSFDEEKKVALIITQNASEDTLTCYEAFNHLRYVLNISFAGDFDNPCKLLLGGGLVTHDSAVSNETLMKKAYDMGVELVSN